MDNIIKNEALLSDCDITVSLIEKKLNILIDEIHKRNKSNFIDINQIVELCIINIFNILFGWEFQICDNCREKCIDASDDKNKTCIQITSNNSIKKIKKTLQNYYNLENNKYRFIYFILGNKKNYRINEKNGIVKKFLSENVLDKNWLIEELKKHESNKDKLSKVYDNLLKVFDNVGISRDMIIKNHNENAQHSLETGLFLKDEIFDISLQLDLSKNIFVDNNIIFRYKESIIYITEEKLVRNYFVPIEKFIEHNVHFNIFDDNMAYLDMITTSFYMDTHIIYKIFNMFKKLQIKYENNVIKNLEAIGISDRKYLCKKQRKIIMGRIEKRQWYDILKYADEHKYDLSDNSDNIFSNVSENICSISLLGAKSKKYKGLALAIISVDSAIRNYKDDAYVDIMWEAGESNYNIDYIVFDNIHYWKVDFTKKYIEDKILNEKILEPVLDD